MANKKGASVAEVVTALAQPLADELGYLLWDVEYVKEVTGWNLIIYIDREDGISLTDCEMVNDAVEPIIDEADPIEGSYTLEISSPGLERELTRAEHFDRFIGADVMVRLIRPMEVLGRDFSGVLTSHDKETVTITDHSGENVVTINKKDAAWIKLDDFD